MSRTHSTRRGAGITADMGVAAGTAPPMRRLRRARLTVSGTPVGEVGVIVASPVGTRREDPLPLLIVHDGPEYSRRAHLSSSIARAAAVGRIPSTRLALLEPGSRDDRYAANADYATTLTEHVLPRVTAAYGIVGKPLLMGASLGALAALEAAWLRPDTFGGLFLQSGSFFVPGLDDEEDFTYWDRVTTWVASVRRARRRRILVPIVMTCGRDEENLGNNLRMAQTLARLGHEVTFHEIPGGHDWRSWESAYDPYLFDLIGHGD